jgi:hypothetical protein
MHGIECVPWWNITEVLCPSMDHQSFKPQKHKKHEGFNPCAFCVFVADQRLWCDAEDAPQPVVELEGRLRTVEVITSNVTHTARAVHRNNVHVI